jgi:archaemetzincin
MILLGMKIIQLNCKGRYFHRAVLLTSIIWAVAWSLLAESPTLPFRIPMREEQVAAVGDVSKLSQIEQRAFRVSREFETIRAPKANDWLTTYSEMNQSYDVFMNSEHFIPDSQSNIIYLLPIGTFVSEKSPSLADLQEYCVAFFGLKVVLLPPMELWRRIDLHSRLRSGNLRQYLTTDMQSLIKKRMPEDAFCILGVTMEDLYPDEKWNFVFGEAEPTARVGVFSFKRFTPDWSRHPWTDESRRLLLRRSCDVLAHEIGHMFALEHCTYFECVMCGSNNQIESDSRPMHCCPVCLRKLRSSACFDLLKRYEALRDFCKTRGLKDEAEWNQRQVTDLTLTH